MASTAAVMHAGQLLDTFRSLHDANSRCCCLLSFGHREENTGCSRCSCGGQRRDAYQQKPSDCLASFHLQRAAILCPHPLALHAGSQLLPVLLSHLPLHLQQAGVICKPKGKQILDQNFQSFPNTTLARMKGAPTLGGPLPAFQVEHQAQTGQIAPA